MAETVCLGQQLQMFDADMGTQMLYPAPSNAELAQDRRSGAKLATGMPDHILEMV